MLAQWMVSSSVICPAAVSVGFAVTLFSLPVQAQMYPQDIHAHSRNIGPSAPTQSFFGRGGAYDTASELLQRREEEERERREIRSANAGCWRILRISLISFGSSMWSS